MTALAPGVHLNGWSLVRLDPLGKRAVVRCESCERIMQASAEALLDGTVKRCGCASRPSSRVEAQPEPSEIFAHEVTKAELFAAHRRHRGQS